MIPKEVSLEFTPAIAADACGLGMRCGMSRVGARLHFTVCKFATASGRRHNVKARWPPSARGPTNT